MLLMKLPKLGCMNNPLNNVLDEIREALRTGFQYIELTLEWPLSTVEILEGAKAELSDLLASFEIPPLIHAPWYLEIASPYEMVRRGALKEAEKIMNFARKIDAKIVTFHPFSPKWLSILKEKARELNLHAFTELTELGEEHSLTICLENTDAGAFTSISAMNFIFSNVPELRLTLDLGHAWLGGAEKLKAYVRHLGYKITHVHAHDNNGQQDMHLPIGAGKLDWSLALGLLKFLDFDKTITLEPHVEDPAYLSYSKERILEYWNKAKELEP
ncbi:MAG: hypothetical protein DRN92_00380 [Thermoproteota archaeon]|nr:MAG: hypothetical protein DRN92_00380 [Candidatus Korarchaeota archaeon]